MLVHEQLGIYLVRLPLPFRLNHINSYAIKGGEGWWLVDTGLNTELNRQAWQQFMTQEGISPRDIKAIFITHAHPDHFGAAGWLQSLTSAPVFISHVDEAAIERVWQVRDNKRVDTFTSMFNSNGMPMSVTQSSYKEMNALATSTHPLPKLNNIELNSTVQLGDFEYRAVFTPGHSDGHLCYFNEEFGVLLCGDHLLPKITPNISLWPEAQPDPLNNYLQSFQDNFWLSVKLALPAHGKPFKNVKERIDEIAAHHVERLNLMKGLVTEEATVYSVSKQAFGENLNAHEVRFAMAETAAHLMYLVYRGELVIKEQGGVFIFNNSPLTKKA